MDFTNETDIIKTFERDGHWPEEVIGKLIATQKSDQSVRATMAARKLAGRVINQNRAFARPSRPGPSKLPDGPGRVVPYGQPMLECASGFTSLTKPTNFVWGTDQVPRFGPQVPVPAGSTQGNPYHRFSVETRAPSGHLSVAVAAGNEANGPGYAAIASIPNSGGCGTTTVAAGLGAVFYLPKIDRRMKTLQASILMSADSNVRNSLVFPYSAVPPSNGGLQWVSVYGILTVTLIEGLAGLFGGVPPRSSNAHTFLYVDEVNGYQDSNVSDIDDSGSTSASTFLTYDGSSEIFFIYADVQITCFVYSSDPTYPVGVACDTRFVQTEGDNVLEIYSDDAMTDRAFQVTQVKLCGTTT